MAEGANAGATAEDDDQQAPRARRQRTFIWIGAVVTIIGTVGSLAFGAITAYLDYQVATDQLEQSEEQAREKIREQASRVIAWTDDPTKKSPSALYIANRSTSPIRYVSVSFEGSRTVGESTEFTEYVIKRRILPPCTILKIPNDGFATSLSGKQRKLEFMTVRWMSFQDGQYRDWANTGRELISGEHKIAELRAQYPGEPGTEQQILHVTRSTATQTDACGT